MSEPTEDDLERAERIRQLRNGGAKSRSREMRERRRERVRDGDRSPADSADADAADPADANAIDADDASDPTDAADADDAAAGPLPAAGDVDVLSLAAQLPEDGSLFVVPIREGMRREFNKVAEQLHLRYGFEYRSELDAEHHVRPLALYLGVQALADSDVEAVKELLESVDELDAPEEGEA